MSAWMIQDKQITAVLNAAVEIGLLKKASIQSMGQSMVDENVKSLVFRYGDREKANAHKYYHVDWLPYVSLAQAHKFACCVDYQCCEHEEWKNSKAKKFIDKLIVSIETKLGHDRKTMTDVVWEGLKWSI